MSESSDSHDTETDARDDSEVIRGKVVDFVNSREIIMSVGKNDGVQIGMQFAILVPGGVTVEYGVGDNKFTDIVEVAKAIVKVVRFSGERLSIGRTFMKIHGHAAYEIDNPAYMLGGSILGRFNPTEPKIKYPAVPDRIETFDVERKDTIRGKIDTDVRVGDEVRLTSGDEFIFP
ncbi:Uncharacterised protein [Mycobacteroides abscessus subsp. bolletii]|uniref:hypothetical protein n=1 Tax=Mycobacteroides abscessus TaxID=36809 RepID=UPI0009A7A524|nr:hypothetical protein [Mycobacteroides abscessus]SKG74952.1 Uncharacterised protein [Mycobacteroides abscessus subsp. bolletii]SKH26121.1 Uncharacterised protein [Mycobacteroides abscessus subsp. bolletii]